MNICNKLHEMCYYSKITRPGISEKSLPKKYQKFTRMRISKIFLFYLAKKIDNHVNLTVIPEIQQYLTNKILHQIKQNLPLPPLHGQINLTEFVEINFIMHTAKFETFLFVQISLINFSNLSNSLYKKQPIKIQITTCKKKKITKIKLQINKFKT